MAFDGITVSALVAEIDDNLKGGRINKIAQPENDELLITGKGANGQKRLLLSASASLPLIYFTDKNRISPLTAPNFCMLLQKAYRKRPNPGCKTAGNGACGGI